METFKFDDQVVRVDVDENGRERFIAADLCRILGLGNNSQAIIDLDDDEKGIMIADTLGGPQKVSFVYESGLYALVFKSRKPEAKRFRKWVCTEVLPTLRKHGRYIAPDADVAVLPTPESIVGNFAAAIAKMRDNALDEGRRQSEAYAQEMRAQVEFVTNELKVVHEVVGEKMAEFGRALMGESTRVKQGEIDGGDDRRLPPDWASSVLPTSLDGDTVAIGLGFKLRREWVDFAERIRWLTHVSGHGERDLSTRQTEMHMDEKWDTQFLVGKGYADRTADAFVSVTPKGRAKLASRLTSMAGLYDLRGPEETITLKIMIRGGKHEEELSELIEAFANNKASSNKRFTQPIARIDGVQNRGSA